MKNYNKSDYAHNKYSENIVYKFADGTVEITVNQFLEQNPNKTKEDFLKFKKISDELYYQELLKENRETRKNIPFSDETDLIQDDNNLQELLCEKETIENLLLAVRVLFKNSYLTEIQKRRFILYYFQGLSTRQIAELENATQHAIMQSISSAKNKLINIFNLF